MGKGQGRKLYSLGESYRIIYLALRTGRYMRRANKSGELAKKFTERIMLAVTEVNQCAMCAYGHTKMALEAGMSNDEIRALLGGSMDAVPPEELAAVLFAQHYADSRGKPSAEAWGRLCDVYGNALAAGILGVVRMIMFGNAYGIAFGALGARLKGKPDPKSSLLYETAMLACLIPFVLSALLCALIAALIKRPVI